MGFWGMLAIVIGTLVLIRLCIPFIHKGVRARHTHMRMKAMIAGLDPQRRELVKQFNAQWAVVKPLEGKYGIHYGERFPKEEQTFLTALDACLHAGGLHEYVEWRMNPFIWRTLFPSN